MSFLFTRLKFSWINCPNFAQCVNPKQFSPKLESTTMVDDYCAGGRVTDEYQGLCACASPSSCVLKKRRICQSVRVLWDQGILTVGFLVSHKLQWSICMIWTSRICWSSSENFLLDLAGQRILQSIITGQVLVKTCIFFSHLRSEYLEVVIACYNSWYWYYS